MRFGTAGIPFSTEPRNTVNGIKTCKQLGLSAMELEFVRNVNVSERLAPEVKKTATENDISLSCHSSYFINLAAKEKEKQDASRERLLKAARILDACGGKSVVVHAGYYLGREPKTIQNTITQQLKKASKILQDEGQAVVLRPETMGKHTQWGTLDEVIKASEEIDSVLPCIDISHMHARTNGGYNTKQEFESILTKIEKHLGKEGLQNMHIHCQGIHYSEKGELNHLMLDESDFNWKTFLTTLKKWKAKGNIISESPNPQADALKMQKYYFNL